jgi:signal transduction histidine kinase
MANKQRETAEVPSVSGASILVVDDHSDVVTMLAELLKRQGHRPTKALSPQRALQLVQSTSFDLILLDINMPITDGYELCRQMKALPDFDSVIMFISANDDIEVRVRAFEAGGVDYFIKPFERIEMMARINSQLELRAQRKLLAQMQVKEMERLSELAKMKDQMLQMVSHDIKNPLSLIISSLELIQSDEEEQPRLGERTQEYLDIMQSSADKILHLVRDVLDIARLEGTADVILEAQPLTPFLQEAVDGAAAAAHLGGVVLLFHPPVEEVRPRLSAMRFHHILDNLLSNAIRYTPSGGTVTVDLINHGAAVDVRVRDTGIGVPPEALPHLFDKFFRVNQSEHRKRSGSGLGLAIVKTLVEQHHGSVWAESQQGVGSTFTVRLPLHSRED